ncbi:MAG: hypothetical protein JWQ21_4103 [Herminiimonas sp.]|nr:hypothetical protein [Herminiimonas sp.]
MTADCQGAVMLKFDFSIKTRDGQKIESIVIAGRDQEDAERKLRQMYRHCEIRLCRIKGSDGKQPGHAISVEEILSLISK